MDSLGDISFSLIFRAEAQAAEKKKDQDNLAPFESLVPKSLKRSLLTPQARIRLVIKSLASQLSSPNARRLLGLLRAAVTQEQEAVGRYMLKMRDRWPASADTREASPCAQLAISVVQLGEAVDNCIAALHEGTPEDLKQAVSALEKSLQAHERMMDIVVSSGEMEGWVLLQRFSGPFSPIIGILGWGITMHLTGLIPERNFLKLLDMVEKEMEGMCGLLKPNLFFIFSWKQAEIEARNAFKLVRGALINRESLSSGIIDPTSLRAALGALAKTLCHLNVMATCFHPDKLKESQAFQAKTRVLTDRNDFGRHVLNLPASFFHEANPDSAN